jgi:glycerophosphoryl diester phosphodiesterase
MKIFAHRGSSLIWPENTLFAFEQAHASGAEGFETDLRLSGDQEIILSHDDNLARSDHPDKTISKLTAAEIQEISIPAKSGKDEDRIITLKTLLARFPDKSYIFDCKITSELLMQKLKDLLAELNFHDRIWFLTWSRQADALVEKYFPTAPVFPRESISRTWGLWSFVGLGNHFEPANKILALPAYHFKTPVFKKNQIEKITAAGKIFIGYIVNDKKSYDRCVACGVQGVLTDRADLISNYLKSSK